MWTQNHRFFSFFLILVLVSLACNLPAGTSSTPTEIVVPQAEAAATEVPLPTSTPAPVVHSVYPVSGQYHESTAHDNEESATYEFKNVQFGDVFEVNRFERPFTVEDMSYLPYLDIFDFVMTSDSTWYYVDIKMIGPDPATGGVHGTFGIEFDLDIDGRAEILVLVTDPGSTWSTDRVQVYLDGNGDVGGGQSAPDIGYTGNGFETLIFDSGQGEDPDLVWAQTKITKRATVQFAIKKSLLRSYTKFMWSVFASKDLVDPTKFYYNDTHSEAAAGSPNKESEYYPIKDIAAFDNSCRVPTGFQASGFEPMGCNVATQVAKEDPDNPGIILIWIPTDINWCLIIDCDPVIK